MQITRAYLNGKLIELRGADRVADLRSAAWGSGSVLADARRAIVGEEDS